MPFQLPNTDEKADYVLRQFDRIAKGYDLSNDLISLGMHRLWKKRAIDELLKSTGTRKGGAAPAQEAVFLDLCCGTGDLALMIAEKVPNGRVVGLDFSGNMLELAKERDRLSRSSKKRCSIEWKQGDAQNLPFADNSFDGAIISFGLRNLTDLQKGLNEMSRVVKPGGTVVNLDLGQPDLPVFTPFFLFFFEQIVPLIGQLIQNDRQAYTYLPESRKTYPHPLKLKEMFQEAGLVEINWHKLALGSVALHTGKVLG